MRSRPVTARRDDVAPAATAQVVPAVAPEPQHRWRWAAAISAAALVWTLLGSWRPSLWTDEASTLSAARRSLPQLVAMAQNIDAVHSTYYALMHVWLAVVPGGAFLLRFPSALAVGLSAGLLYLTGARLAGHRTGVVAGLVLMLLPRSTWMGIEARPFALSALLAVAATALLVHLVPGSRAPGGRWTGRERWWLALYAVVLGLGIAVNVYVALVLAAHGVSVLLATRSWRERAGWLGAGVVAVLLASGVVWTAVHQTGQLGDAELSPAGLVRNVVVNQWFLGETPTLTTGARRPGDLGWRVASVLTALVGWALVALALLAARRPASAGRRVVVWALPWIAVPTSLVALYSLAVDNLYNARYFSMTVGGMALLIASGVLVAADRLGARRGRGGPVLWAGLLVVVLAVTSLPVYVSQRGLHAKSGNDWSEVAAVVAAHREPGSGVYFSPRFEVVGPLVGPTSRGVSVAYPAAFAGLVDVTLLRSGVEEENLVGLSRRLADSAPQLAELDHVWVVRRLDYRYVQQDDQVLRAAGFAPDLQWRGPLDEVVRYSR